MRRLLNIQLNLICIIIRHLILREYEKVNITDKFLSFLSSLNKSYDKWKITDVHSRGLYAVV